MCRPLLMTLAFCLILFGISGLWMMPKLVQQKIEQRIQLKIGTKTMDRFTRVPIPLTVKFYLFNITNSEQVLSGLEAPNFKEIGPFMYKQWRRRELVDFEDYNRRLRYREYKTFYSMFNEQQIAQSMTNNSNSKTTTKATSDNLLHNNNNKLHNNDIAQNHSENDRPIEMLDPSKTNVTIINLPLLSLLTKLAQLEDGSLKRKLAAKVAGRLIADGRDKILISKPVNELLFDGYKVDFMESARDLVSGTLGYNYESPLPRNTFGFFYLKNGTWSRRENGELTVFTGRNESMNDFMLIENWNDQRQLSVWPTNTQAGNTCNEIRGTDGSQFHPGATRHQVLNVFSPMVCTSIKLHFVEDTEARGIPLLRFSTAPDTFAAPKKTPKNACYCTIQPPSSKTQSSSGGSGQTSNAGAGSNNQSARITDSRCYLDGLIDLSLCQRGAPIAASSPHFYRGEPILAMAAGLRPEKRRHETYIDVEPMTGSVFRAASRAQLNAYVEEAALEVIDSSIIGRMTPMVAPLLWLEESAEIDEKSANEFKRQLLNLVQKARRTFIICLIAGIVLALVVGGHYCYVTCWAIDVSSSRRDLNKNKNKSRIKGSSGDLRRKRRQERDTSGGHQMEANLRLGVGARESNIYGRKNDNLLGGLSARSGEQSPEPSGDGSGFAAGAVPVIAAAALLGAASAGPSRGSRRHEPQAKRPHRLRSAAPVDQQAADGDDEDNQDSEEKRLVGANEWELEAATSATSGRELSSGEEQEDRGRAQEADR